VRRLWVAAVLGLAEADLMNAAAIAPLVPELDVTDLAVSLAFYVDVLQFNVAWERPEERFAFLECDGVQLMLEQADGPGRRFRTAPLTRPYGRGINFQIQVPDLDALLARVVSAGLTTLVPLEQRSYRAGTAWITNRQFAISDPDGYLLRFVSMVGAAE
jgi:catechol 2,3-dioxygenase-like lactoylglutathione lyase family enzyme